LAAPEFNVDEAVKVDLVNITPCVDIQYFDDVVFRLIDNPVFADS